MTVGDGGGVLANLRSGARPGTRRVCDSAVGIAAGWGDDEAIGPGAFNDANARIG
jgi:hypothetical protein